VDQQQSRWRHTRSQLLWASGIVAVSTISTLIGYRYGVTLWDWIKLLIVPAVIAGVGIWFNHQQREREQYIAEQRAQDAALQAYLDQMSQLLLDKDRPLRQSEEGDEVRTLARAPTLTVLSRLDGERKGSVLRFLSESNLITKNQVIINLKGANLQGANLSWTHLTGADLSDANMSNANLSYAQGVTKEQLAQAKSLEYATMPNGQKYEDWLKSREGEAG
jgi:hypothetical protein